MLRSRLEPGVDEQRDFDYSIAAVALLHIKLVFSRVAPFCFYE